MPQLLIINYSLLINKKNALKCVLSSPVFTMIDFDIVVILKILLLVSLSFVAVAFQFFTSVFLRFGEFGFVFFRFFIERCKSCFFVVHYYAVIFVFRLIFLAKRRTVRLS